MENFLKMTDRMSTLSLGLISNILTPTGLVWPATQIVLKNQRQEPRGDPGVSNAVRGSLSKTAEGK